MTWTPGGWCILFLVGAVLVAFLVSAVGSAAYFLNITNVPTYLEQAPGVTSSTSLWLGTVAALVAIVVTPFIGLASDHVGRRPVLILIVLVILLTTLPAYLMPGNGTGSTVILGGLSPFVATWLMTVTGSPLCTGLVRRRDRPRGRRPPPLPLPR